MTCLSLFEELRGCRWKTASGTWNCHRQCLDWCNKVNLFLSYLTNSCAHPEWKDRCHIVSLPNCTFMRLFSEAKTESLSKIMTLTGDFLSQLAHPVHRWYLFIVFSTDIYPCWYFTTHLALEWYLLLMRWKKGAGHTFAFLNCSKKLQFCIATLCCISKTH